MAAAKEGEIGVDAGIFLVWDLVCSAELDHAHKRATARSAYYIPIADR
jgi:hypothetical protein